MANLISANLFRLRRSAVFWALLLFEALYAFYCAWTWDRGSGMHYLMAFSADTGLISAVLISLFLGADYNCGTIRGKLAVGHRRSDIYLANLLAVFLGVLALSGVHLAVRLAAGAAYAGGVSPELLPLMLLAAVGMIAGFCALYTCISMLCGQIALTVLACLLCAVALISASASLHDLLSIPAQLSIDVLEGGTLATQEYANPRYLSGPLRALCQFLLNVQPAGQAYRMDNRLSAGELLQLTGYAAAFTGVVSALGMGLFQRKDVK